MPKQCHLTCLLSLFNIYFRQITTTIQISGYGLVTLCCETAKKRSRTGVTNHFRDALFQNVHIYTMDY